MTTRLEDYEALSESYNRLRLEAAELRDWKTAHKCPKRIGWRGIVAITISVSSAIIGILVITTCSRREPEKKTDDEIMTVLCWRVDELVHTTGDKVKRAFHVVGVTDEKWLNIEGKPPKLVWDRAFDLRNDAWNFIKRDGRPICPSEAEKKK